MTHTATQLTQIADTIVAHAKTGSSDFDLTYLMNRHNLTTADADRAAELAEEWSCDYADMLARDTHGVDGDEWMHTEHQRRAAAALLAAATYDLEDAE